MSESESDADFDEEPSALGVKVGRTRTVVSAGDADDPATAAARGAHRIAARLVELGEY